MNLIIDSELGVPLNAFLQEKLIPEMQEYFISSINNRKLEPFDEYINSLDNIQYGLPQGKKRYLSTKDLLLSCIYNLTYSISADDCIIEINSSKIAPNTNAKLLWIAKLVNYGNMQLAPYPLFTELFDHFADIFWDILKEYKEEEGVE